jgi:RecJ-like exonuclease
MTRRQALVLLLSLPALARGKPKAPPRKVQPAQAGGHKGEVVTVVGQVVQITHSPQGHVYLNFGAPYPKQQFAAIIFQNEVKLFPKVDALKGKTIEVTGKVKDYKGQAQIQLYSPTQLATR